MNKNISLLFKTMTVLLMLLLSVTFLTACAPAPKKSPVNSTQTTDGAKTYPTKISLDEAIEIMAEDKTIKLIDVRTKEEYDAGHVVGALLIPLDVLLEKIGEHITDKNTPVILYCRSGNRSAQGAKILRNEGYATVIDAGGINRFKGELEKSR